MPWRLIINIVYMYELQKSLKVPGRFYNLPNSLLALSCIVNKAAPPRHTRSGLVHAIGSALFHRGCGQSLNINVINNKHTVQSPALFKSKRLRSERCHIDYHWPLDRLVSAAICNSRSPSFGRRGY